MDKKKKVNKLENLKITSVDLCTQGANPEAYIKFYKSQDEEVKREMNEDIEKTKEEKMEVTKGFILEKMEEEDQKTLKALMDKYNVEGEENPDKEEKKEDKKEEEAIEEANKGMKKAMDDDAKAAVDAEIQKAMDELNAAKKEYKIAQLAKSFVKYEDLGMDPEEVAKKYVNLKEADEEVAKSYIDVLDDKLDLQDKQGIFKSFGRNGKSRPGWDGIEAKADEIRKAQPTMTREQAIAKAMDANPELVAEYEAQR